MFEWLLGVLCGFAIAFAFLVFVFSNDSYKIEKCYVAKQHFGKISVKPIVKAYDASNDNVGKNCFKFQPKP